MNAFERFAPAIAVYFAGCAMVPLVFAAVVVSGGTPVTPELYGTVVYAIPALVWAALQLGLSLLAAVSAAMGWRLMAAFGAFGIAALLGFFSAAAVLAGASGTLVVAGCGAWLSPVSLIAAWVCWYDR
jgi:hypothetical protein